MPNTIPAAGEAMPENRIYSPKLHEALSFVKFKKRKGAGYDYWTNVPVGSSYTEDCAIGRERAEEFMAFSGKYPSYGNSTLLGAIALAMEANGATRGHKIGFMNTINKYAMVGAYLDTKGEKAPLDPKTRLESLTSEIAKIIASSPDMMIDHVTVNKSGVYTEFEIAGGEENPWVKARRLMKELSSTLSGCDEAKWSAYVMPPTPPVFNGFAAYPMGEKPDELPVDHIERLSWELSEALSRYQGGSFSAMVLPSSSAGHTVMLTKISAFERRTKA